MNGGNKGDHAAGTYVRLRPAAPGDAEVIVRIWSEGWMDGHLGHVPAALVAHRGADQFEVRAVERLPACTVAEIDELVVGFVVVLEDQVEQLYVDRAARGGPAAAALLSHAEGTIAAVHGVGWLAVVAGNARARRFYERCGWQDAGGFDYPAQAGDGTIAMPSRRYVKRVGEHRGTGEVEP